MKRLPGLFNDSFDEVFKDPFFSRNMEYMKTDIREKDNTYILEVELPGYQKEDIHMELQNGYLSIQAAHHQVKEDKDDKGNLIRQERYSGTCKRSFYVDVYKRQDEDTAEIYQKWIDDFCNHIPADKQKYYRNKLNTQTELR